MSARVAAGWNLSSRQSVSVVPSSQCRPHGMMNSTLVAVRRITPVSSCTRSRGTTRCTPLEARTRNLPRSPTSPWTSSVHTPVALTTSRAATSSSSPVVMSRTRTPVARPASRSSPTTSALETTAAP